MSRSRFWVIAFLALITNGFSLLGMGQASAGSLARTIECNHNIAQNILVAKALGAMMGSAPIKPRIASFGPFLVDCAKARICGAAI
ncbi:hypothetical protein [Pseudomonas sp. Q11]|uniref:hypothetical protein n=1 Tax=Pseudomonas sp. Q11 TaxID=2968470 RepID=UPI00210A11AA|nr:hypothetical protein [Pseudomonas sp. Q11]MCQ6254951.1 hypothetical protein [Pseudomonas sp. Q11]